MSAPDNKLVVQRFWNEVVNQGQTGVIDQIFTPRCVLHDPLIGKAKGLDTIKVLVGMIRTAFPDIQVNIESQMAAEGDRVITQWVGTGTHTGRIVDEWVVEPTGESVEVPGTSISRVVGGRIEEIWLVIEPLEDEDPHIGVGSLFCKHFPRLC